MSDQFLKCPNCGFMKFYLEDGEQGMTFVKVKLDRTVILVEGGGAGFSAPETAKFQCAGCAWHGTVDQMEA